MKPDIKELYKIEKKDYQKLYDMYLEAFADYPKLMKAFPDDEVRREAITMVISYYLAYDLAYGATFSTDEDINEAVTVLFSDEVDYSEERCSAADCENGEFQKAASKLNGQQLQLWWEFFDELDRTEAELEIPAPHIYADYVAVRKGLQGQGRGTGIIQALCRYADEMDLPVMLFTNGEEDVRFYLKNGFRIIGVTESAEYGLENTYMLYEPGSRHEE